MKKKNGKLRIAMLGQKRVPSREGGIEVVVEELSTRMVQRGYEVTCFNRKGHHVSGVEYDVEMPKEYKGIRIKPVFTIERRGFAAFTSSVFGAIKSAFGGYDIVHFHAEGPCAMLWLPKLFGKRCIATIHGLDHQRDKWGRLASAYIMLGEKCAVKFADEIIVLSYGVKDYFKDVYGRKTRFIPNGATPADRLKADIITSRFGLEKNGYILYLGRIVPEKGIKYLIESFKKVDTDKKLVIAGGASDTDGFFRSIKEMAQDDDRIVFTGFVQGQVLSELFSNAYVYILPSDLEGMPLSLLEAMSYKNCCLVSDIPECADVVEDKAVIFKKGDVSDLGEKIQMLCDDPELVKKYKSQSAEFICDKYNWDDVVEKTLKIYENED